LRQMLREEDNGEDITGYGLGDVRSHRDYELYAGIDFAQRRLHAETLAGKEPPCTYVNEEQWKWAFVLDHKLEMKWKADDIEPCDDYKFIYFGIEDHLGNVLHRYDASHESDETLLKTTRKEVAFRASSKPAKLVVWPVSHSRGWLKKVVYDL